MMKELFGLYLQAGIFGSVLIAVILIARLFLRKAPRRVLCVVWLLAVLRLLVPFQIESIFSLQPQQLSFSTPVQEETVSPPLAEPDAPADTPVVTPQTGTQNAVPVPAPAAPVDYFLIVSVFWGIVACGFLLYGIISYLIFKTKVREAIQQPDGTKECARISNAFLIGLFRPVIYLPTNLTPQEKEFIIAHEKAHIAHGDNWWKVLGYLCLSLHWYNPFVWICFHLFSKDIEIACDETVVRNLDIEPRKAYSMALLKFGKQSAIPYLPSSSFGKINLKQRLSYILSYRKPRLWISVIAILLVAVIAVCFLTSPRPKDKTPSQDQQASAAPTETQPDNVPEGPAENVPTTPATPTEPEPTEPEPTEPEPTEPEPTEPEPTEPEPAEPTPPVTSLPDPPSDTRDIDITAIDTNATAYAGGLGFQALDSYPNTNVKDFVATCWKTPSLTQSQLQSTACQLVDTAYRYCVNNQHPVTASVLWVDVYYDGYMQVYTIRVYCAV